MKTKKVIITGTSGRIGSAIANEFKSHNYDVRGIDKVKGIHTTDVFDMTDISQMKKLVEGADGIIHTAAYLTPHVGHVPDKEFQRINVEATKSIAKLAIESGVKKFIFTSTTALFGFASSNGREASWIDEQTTPLPKSIYHKTKLMAENVLRELAKNSDMKIVSIRMSRCFPEPADMMAVYRLHRGIDKRDVAVAHRLSFEKEGLPNFDCFIISGQTPFSKSDTKELYFNPKKVIAHYLPNLIVQMESISGSFPDSIDRVYDSSKAVRILGWNPKYGYDDVIMQLKNNSSDVLPISNTKRTESE